LPLYEYVCEKCECKFELLRKFAQADQQATCPRCGCDGTQRVPSLFAAVGVRAEGLGASVTGSSSCSSCAATSCAGCKR
jgi:putative FmdB family regulatory protein